MATTDMITSWCFASWFAEINGPGRRSIVLGVFEYRTCTSPRASRGHDTFRDSCPALRIQSPVKKELENIVRWTVVEI